MPLFSIVIPTYNSEKYISKCLDSILSQSFSNYEIIIIDDDSRDDTKKIISNYKNKNYKKIIFFQFKKNKGPGEARNKGIKEAKGKYILFVDSDDSLIEDSLLSLEKHILNFKFPEILIYNYYTIHDKTNKKTINPNIKNLTDLHSGDQLFHLINPAPWNKLVSRQFWIKNQLSFPEKIYFEDLAVILYMSLKSKKIFITNDILYNYNFHKNNISNTHTNHHLTSIFKSLDYLFSLIKNDEKINFKKIEFNLYNLTFFHLHYTLSSKMNKLSDLQISKFILLFNNFNKKNKIDFLTYIKTENGINLISLIFKLIKRKKLDNKIVPYLNENFFFNLMALSSKKQLNTLNN